MKRQKDDDINPTEYRNNKRVIKTSHKRQKRGNTENTSKENEKNIVKEVPAETVEKVAETKITKEVVETKQETVHVEKTVEENNDNQYFEDTSRPKSTKGEKVWATIVCIVLFLGICAVVAAGIFAYKLLENKPDFSAEKLYSENSSIIYDAKGNEVVELGLYLRENIDYRDMPNCLVDAFMSIEDSRYFQHFGFDIPRFTKAIIENIRTMDFGQGGSTITMQLVKNSYFQVDAGSESTMAAADGMSGVKRKMQEIVLAIEANYSLDKKDILALYINKINFGNKIRGIEKAAQYYFGKSACEMNLVESAFLAGIINAPNNFNPYNEKYKNDESYIYLNPNITYLENAQERTAEVLDLMVYHGYLSKEEAKLAKCVKIENLLSGVSAKFNDYTGYYQSYIDAVIDEAQEVTGKDPYTTAMRIYSNMDPHMQEVLYNIQNEKTELKYHKDIEQSALVVLNNQTGELVALGGGRNQAEEVRQFNRATSAYIQPGSAIKPILEYVLAFDRLGWSPQGVITDQPYYLYNGNVLIANAGGQGYTGDMLITEAIARSLNTPAVQTLAAVIEEIGEDGVKDYLRSIGITANLDTFDLQWAIGGNTCLVTPVQLAGAHAMLINDGYYVTPHTIHHIEFDDEEIEDYVADTVGNQVVSSAAAYMAAYCEANNVSGQFYNLMQILKRDYPVYAKTGTTDWATAGRAFGIPTGAPKDCWLVCQTSNYTVSVWLGFDKLEEGSYFTSAQDLSNLKGKMGKMILDELDAYYDYGPTAIEKPEDCVTERIVKGSFPYCVPDGAHETIEALFSQKALEEHPLSTVSEVLANLPIKRVSGAAGLSGSIGEDGVARISLITSGTSGTGVVDISATNAFGKTTHATGRCYFPHYSYVYEGSGEVTVELKVDGNVINSGVTSDYIEFYGVPAEGSVSACVMGDSNLCTKLR